MAQQPRLGLRKFREASPAPAGPLPRTPTRSPRVVRWEAYLPRDRHLVWSVAPVLAEGLVPPEMCWAPLGIQKQPPFPVVMAHLKCLTSEA